jgi:hypothetical protein
VPRLGPPLSAAARAYLDAFTAYVKNGGRDDPFVWDLVNACLDELIAETNAKPDLRYGGIDPFRDRSNAPATTGPWTSLTHRRTRPPSAA